jgi:hypothetical protein
MEEKNNMEENGLDTAKELKECITDEEAKTFLNLFRKCLKSYKEKDASVTDEEWLQQLFKDEIKGTTDEEAEDAAKEIMESLHTYDENLKSVNEAAVSGKSKESWLANKIQESAVGMSVHEYGQILQTMDDVLYQKNMEIADALSRAKDGHIMMSPNLDGNIAENLVAKTTELSGLLEGKNIRVDVLESFTANSVDVRAVDIETGRYQNYQLKFGKDAKATIGLIERGNYNNQRIVVPAEQLDEVQTYFSEKGSAKTISDHIEAFGVEGRKFTKEDVKSLQVSAQEDGIMPSMDYSHYQTKDLAMSIGKNAGVMALQSAAIVTGVNIAAKVANGEKIDSDELVENAIRTGADTSVKVVTAGALQVAVRNGVLRIIPKMTPAGVIANIAAVAVEDAKVLVKVASGEMTLTKGLDHMGRISVSMTAGLCSIKAGMAIGAWLVGWIPVIGPVAKIATGFIGGMVGYCAGSKVGEAVYNGAKKIAKAAVSVGKAAWNAVKKIAKKWNPKPVIMKSRRKIF